MLRAIIAYKDAIKNSNDIRDNFELLSTYEVISTILENVCKEKIEPKINNAIDFGFTQAKVSLGLYSYFLEIVPDLKFNSAAEENKLYLKYAKVLEEDLNSLGYYIDNMSVQLNIVFDLIWKPEYEVKCTEWDLSNFYYFSKVTKDGMNLLNLEV